MDSSLSDSSLTAASNMSGFPEPEARARWMIYGLLITISMTVLLTSLFESKQLQSGNDRSRWCTVWSLVERGTYQIDEITEKKGWGTIDKVMHEEHLYSSKPALLPTLLAGVYWGVKNLFGLDLLSQTEQTVRAILFFVNVVPYLVAMILWARFLERYSRRFSTRLFLLTVMGLGTLLLPFSTVLNNHTVAAFSFFFSLYALVRILDQSDTPAWYFGIVGFFAAFTCTNELPAAIYGLASFFVLLKHDFKNMARYYVPAAVVPLAAFFITTYLSTGGFKPFYMYYGTEKYLFVKDGIPSYWFNPGGIDQSLDTPLQYLFHCLLGHHGLFSLTPVFLVSVYGWFLCGLPQVETDSQLSKGLRVAALLGALFSIILMMFYLSRTANYNYGGLTAGLRWTFWVIPVWLIAMVPACDRLMSRWWFVPVSILFLMVSMYSALAPLSNPWQKPWLFAMMEQAGWIDYSTPAPKVEETRRTWLKNLPAPGKTEWIELTEERFDGTRRTVRLTGEGKESEVLVTVKWSDQESSVQGRIDRKNFEAGTEIQKWLSKTGADDSEEKWREFVLFLQGIPKTNTYRAAKHRFLKTKVRPEAFHTLLVRSSVTIRLEGEKREFYCLVYWCDDVPFGVTRLFQYVANRESGERYLQRSLVLSGASEIAPFKNPYEELKPHRASGR